jgi:hypothetical protein
MQWVLKSFAKLLNACQDFIHSAKQFSRPYIVGCLMFLDTTRPNGKSDPLRTLGINRFWIRVKDKLHGAIL